jgi:ABC-2 type transport system permease protein
MIGRVFKNWRTMWMVAEITFRLQVMDSFILFGILVQPLIIAILAMWMLKDKGADAAVFVVVGSGMTGLWSSLLFVSGNSINDERWEGTLESLIAVPTPLDIIIFGKNLANVIQSLLSMIASYIFVALLFHYPIHLANPLLFFISLIFTVIAFISFGLIIAPIFLVSPGVQRFQNAMEFPVYILSGFLFPIALLPGWTTPVSYLLPTYWAAQALHGASEGTASPQQIFFYWGMLVVFSIVYLVLANRLFARVLVKARSDASLSLE